MAATVMLGVPATGLLRETPVGELAGLSVSEGHLCRSPATIDLWICGQCVVPIMISDILDACREVLEINGDPQTAYWLASQMVEMRMWRASEHDVRAALEQGHRQVGRTVTVRESGRR